MGAIYTWFFLSFIIIFLNKTRQYKNLVILTALLIFLNFVNTIYEIKDLFTLEFLAITFFLINQNCRNKTRKRILLAILILSFLIFKLKGIFTEKILYLIWLTLILIKEYRSKREIYIWFFIYIVSVIVILASRFPPLDFISFLFSFYYLYEILANLLDEFDNSKARYREVVNRAINSEIREKMNVIYDELRISHKKLKEIFKLSNYTILPIELEDIASRVLQGLINLGYRGVAVVLNVGKDKLFYKNGFFPNISHIKNLDLKSLDEIEIREDGRVVILPLKKENETIGFIAVYKKEGISPSEIEFLKTYSNSVAIAIAKTLYFKEKEALKYSLLQAEKHAVIGKLAAGISHNIKNPLATITSSAFAIRRKLKKGKLDEIEVLIDRIEKNSKHAEEIINRLLDYAKPSFLNKEKINLKDLIKNSIDLVKPSIKGKKIEFIEETEDLEIIGDKNFLQQALVNILINSIEAIEEEGKIEIKAFRNGNKAVIKIKDNGKGIPEEIIENIFEPYFTTKPSGTGLGLAIVHKIIMEHRGNIKINSEKDKGTEFIIELPLDFKEERENENKNRERSELHQKEM